MRTLHISIILGISFLSFVFIMNFQNSYAYTCAVKAPSVTTQYYYLHSDSVFVGTVSSITNNTDHQLNVKFDVEKSWKGSQHPTITTYGLVACGYSLVRGEKYLVFANGSPLDYDPWATKSFDNARDDIVLLDSPQFQEKANVDAVLYKKLVNAKDALFNIMGSKMSKIPISYVWANDLNFTLDVGIADKKALLQSGAQEYKQKLEEIVGNVPIRVQYGEYATALPEIITQHQIQLQSPLKQFKSGIKAENVKCNSDLLLAIKLDYSPSCITESSAIKLFLRGWTYGFANYQPVYFMKHNMHAEISVKYSPSNHGSMSSDLLDLYPRAYSKTNSNYPTDAIYANANPDMVSQNTDTVVKYTVMAQNNTRGVYWLSLDNMCELVPIAVDVDESNLTISDLQSPATAWKCPGSTMQYHVIGVSGVTVGLVPIRN